MIYRDAVMEQLKDILNNQWVINIGTGLVVYIITNVSSRFIINKATNKEKQRQIENANKEVIRILKPYIVEKRFLNEQIIISIINSISRKYKLNNADIYNVKEICEELIKEILENSYVDKEKKAEYIHFLHDIADITELEKLGINLERKYQITMDKSKVYNMLSLYMCLVVMVISVMVTIFSQNEYDIFFDISEPMQISILIIIAEIGTLVAILYLKMIRERKNSKIKLKNAKSERENHPKKNLLENIDV